MTELAEVFFANGSVEQEEGDPIIWKTILTPGRLELTPGPNGTKVKKPLNIVEGHSDDPTSIGLQDLMDSYEAGAIQHVTIPTSHSNNVLENTGFLRGLRMVQENGKNVLKAGLEFLDPAVREKVNQGTIANVSCGILKNYERQRDGRMFNAIIDHVALTNKPWVDGMTPFSENPAEGFYFADEVDLAVYNQSTNAPFDYTAHGVEEINPTDTSGVKWDASISMLARRHVLDDTIDADCPGCELIDFTPTKILVEENDQMYVTGYTVETDGSIKIHPREEWLEYTPLTDLSEDHNKLEGGKDPMDEVLLAEKDALQAELEAARAEIAEKNSRLESAARKEQASAIKDRVRELAAVGLSELPGFLAVVEEIMLADTGVESVMLSEDGVEKGATTTQVVERLIAALPRKEDRIVLGEQHQELVGDVKPPLEEVAPSVEDRAAAAREFLGLNDKKTVLA